MEVVLERADERAPWSLAVRVRDAGDDWSDDLRVDDRRAYLTCCDALADCKARAQDVIDAGRQARVGQSSRRSVASFRKASCW